MTITKTFTFQGSHIVRNCSSERCKYSIHGHTYVVEVELSGSKLDNGGMVVDFGLTKTTIKEFIKSFDNAVTVWNRDIDFKQFVEDRIDRIVTLPVSPSAEWYSIIILYLIDGVIKSTSFANNEPLDLKVESVTVHETRTGKAKARQEDLQMLVDERIGYDDIHFNDAIVQNWSDKEMFDKIKHFINNSGERPFHNKTPEQQV